MSISEFKAWFEGFSEGIDKTPTAKQWAKINEKVAAITPEPTKIEYIREYYDRYRPYWAWQQTLTTADYEGWSTEAFKAMGRADFNA